MYIQSDFKRGDLIELHDSTECTITNFHPNVAYIVVSHPSQKKPYSIPINQIKKIVSSPLPLEIADRVIDDDGSEGEILSISDKHINIRKSNIITSHNLATGNPKIKKLDRSQKQTKRGGKREGAGRKPTGNPPKKRKAIQLPEAIAAKLPDLKLLTELLEEFRPIAESGQLRSQKLADFYKKLDSIPKIVKY
ncbi:MAG: hypothetical protein ACK5L1_03760 [Pseudanabaena sp.]|jgi:hypothetical protein